MKYLVTFILLCSLVACRVALSQNQAKPVSLIRVIANPEELDGERVTVVGFLVMGERSILFVHREDAEHNLSLNSVAVISSEEMKHHREQLNGMYVNIVGVLRSVPGADGQPATVIKDIKACTVWSNPARPLSHESYGKKHQEP